MVSSVVVVEPIVVVVDAVEDPVQEISLTSAAVVFKVLANSAKAKAE